MLLIAIFFFFAAPWAHPSYMNCGRMQQKVANGQPSGTIMGAAINGGGGAPLLGANMVQNLPVCINANQAYTVTLAGQGSGRVLKLAGDVTFTGASARGECNDGSRADCIFTQGCSKTGVAGGIGYAAFGGAAKQVQFTAASQSAILVSVAYTQGGPGSAAVWTAQTQVPACDPNNPITPPTPVTQPPPVNNPNPVNPNPNPVNPIPNGPIPIPDQGPPRNGGPTFELDLLLRLSATVTSQDELAVKAALSMQLNVPEFYIDMPTYNKATLFLIDGAEVAAMQAMITEVTTKNGRGRNARSPLGLAIRQMILEFDGRNVDVTVTVTATPKQINIPQEPSCASFWYSNMELGAPAGNSVTIEAFIAGERVHVRATGPADRWYSVALGQGMNEVDAWIVDGNGAELQDYYLRFQNAPQVLLDNSQNLENKDVYEVDGVRTIDFWRQRITGDSQDKPFLCQAMQSMTYATGANAGDNAPSYHQANKGTVLARFDHLNSGVGPPPTERPTSAPTGTPTNAPTAEPTTMMPTPTPVSQSPTARPQGTGAGSGSGAGAPNSAYVTTITLALGGVTSEDRGLLDAAFYQVMTINPLYIDSREFNEWTVYTANAAERDAVEQQVAQIDWSAAVSQTTGKQVTATATVVSAPLNAECMEMRQLSGILYEGPEGDISFEFFQAGDKFQMRIRGSTDTWFSAGIPAPNSAPNQKMPSADVWIYDPSTQNFDDYYIDGFSPQMDEQLGGQMSFAQRQVNPIDGGIEIAFWRDLDTGDVTDNPIGCTDDLEIVWAGGSAGQVGIGQHAPNRRGSSTFTPQPVTTTLGPGGLSPVKGGSDDSELQKRQVHGMLMVLAWLILIPTGMLTATFRHLLCMEDKMCYNACGDKHDGRVANWFKIHRFVNTFGVLLTLVAVGMAYQFAVTPVSTSEHAKLGYGIVLLSLLQTGMGIMRPAKEAPNRVKFLWAHRVVGLTTLAAAVYQIHGALAKDKYGEIMREYIGDMDLATLQQGVMFWGSLVIAATIIEIGRRHFNGEASGDVMEKNRVATVV